MLYPSIIREVLDELVLANADYLKRCIEEQCSTLGGALVYCENVFFHSLILPEAGEG